METPDGPTRRARHRQCAARPGATGHASAARSTGTSCRTARGCSSSTRAAPARCRVAAGTRCSGWSTPKSFGSAVERRQSARRAWRADRAEHLANSGSCVTDANPAVSTPVTNWVTKDPYSQGYSHSWRPRPATGAGGSRGEVGRGAATRSGRPAAAARARLAPARARATPARAYGAATTGRVRSVSRSGSCSPATRRPGGPEPPRGADRPPAARGAGTPVACDPPCAGARTGGSPGDLGTCGTDGTDGTDGVKGTGVATGGRGGSAGSWVGGPGNSIAATADSATMSASATANTTPCFFIPLFRFPATVYPPEGGVELREDELRRASPRAPAPARA